MTSTISEMQTVGEASNMIPNNVLVLGPPKSGKIRIAQYITNDLDTETIQSHSHSGLIYNCDLTTKYFLVSLNLLIEEYPEERTTGQKEYHEHLEKWQSEFASEEFAELREALDGAIFTFNMESTEPDQLQKSLQVFSKVKDVLGENWEGFCVVAGTSDHPVDELKVEALEDEVLLFGFEFVNFNESGTNEYRDTLGKDRLREVLDTHEWSHTDSADNEKYMKHKEDKVDAMTKGLLDDEKVSLDDLFAKLQVERTKVQEMKSEDREAYVQKVIGEMIDYV